MGGDYTRFTFDPKHNFSKVLQQQGRVGLDSDLNEGMDIIDRRFRAETLDVFGKSAVPSKTSDGFKIAIKNNGGVPTITIGLGRMYVDGLLVENHGLDSGKVEWDTELEELQRKKDEPVDYKTQQPFYPDPDDLPEDSPFLVYLDVWEREITAIEQPGLIEKAVGVDTTTRQQIVWQVKIFKGNGNWEQLLAEWELEFKGQSPRGLLSTEAIEVTSDKGPCFLPPSGKYQGGDNRLYRVEIHDLGKPEEPGVENVATFKWSRDNATLTVAVEKIEGNVITVDQTGRDEVARFSGGDWVEFIDDQREYHRIPGEMRKIVSVNDSIREISLSKTLSDAGFANGDDEHKRRHTRMRKWDQKGAVVTATGVEYCDIEDENYNGVIPVPPPETSLILEDGVKVTFSTNSSDADPPEKLFRTADYWAFTARTADASIEELENAPPRGVHHHYCPLALVNFADEINPVKDLRNHWPQTEGEGCCTIVVHPDDDIHKALEDPRLKNGGCICLKTGVHEITKLIEISGLKNIILKGESPGAIITGADTPSDLPPVLLFVNDSSDVTVEGITFEGGKNGQSGILVSGGKNVCVKGNQFTKFPDAGENPSFLIGITLVGTSESVVEGNHIDRAETGIALYFGNGNEIRTNTIKNGNYGILVGVQVLLNVSGNAIANMKNFGFYGRQCFLTLALSQNRFVSCGYQPSSLRIGGGICVGASLAELIIESCEVLRTGALNQEYQTRQEEMAIGILVAGVLSCRINGNLILNTTALDPKSDLRNKPDRVILAYALETILPPVALGEGVGGGVQPSGLPSSIRTAVFTNNKFVGHGHPHLIEFLERGQCKSEEPLSTSFSNVIFNSNTCVHFAARSIVDGDFSTVLIRGLNLAVTANQIMSLRGLREPLCPIHIEKPSNVNQQVVLMGNLTSGEIQIDSDSQVSPTQWKGFNPIMLY